MKKSIVIVDWLLLVIFILMILSNFVNLPFTKIIQPIFFVLVIIHIAQHWRFFYNPIKKLIKKKSE